jgi:hypothetical protein
VGSGAGLDLLEKRKFFALREPNHVSSVVEPVAESLYQIRNSSSAVEINFIEAIQN